MDKLRALRYFKRVAELHSFSEAATVFDVPSSSISRRIKDLEEHLGVELLQRSTRSVQLTELGAHYYAMISEGMRTLDDADELVSHRGIIRISSMPSYGERILTPVLEAFHQTYPKIVFDIHYSDELVVLGKDPFDIAIRGGYAPDERVIARRLADNQFILVATPKYLSTLNCPTPLSLSVLKSCQTLQYRGPKGLIHWYAKDRDGWEKFDINPVMISNNGTALVSAALNHRGIVCMPRWGIQSYLDSAEMIEVPTETPVSVNQAENLGIFLLYFKTRYQLPKIKLCVDFLISHLQDNNNSSY